MQVKFLYQRFHTYDLYDTYKKPSQKKEKAKKVDTKSNPGRNKFLFYLDDPNVKFIDNERNWKFVCQNSTIQSQKENRSEKNQVKIYNYKTKVVSQPPSKIHL